MAEPVKNYAWYLSQAGGDDRLAGNTIRSDAGMAPMYSPEQLSQPRDIDLQAVMTKAFGSPENYYAQRAGGATPSATGLPPPIGLPGSPISRLGTANAPQRFSPLGSQQWMQNRAMRDQNRAMRDMFDVGDMKKAFRKGDFSQLAGMFGNLFGGTQGLQGQQYQAPYSRSFMGPGNTPAAYRPMPALPGASIPRLNAPGSMPQVNMSQFQPAFGGQGAYAPRGQYTGPMPGSNQVLPPNYIMGPMGIPVPADSMFNGPTGT